MTTTPDIRDYLQNTVPWGKQAEAFAFSVDPGRRFGDRYAALLMEQRTGKTPVAVAWIVYHYEATRIDAALVVSMPSGVPRNWAAEIDGDPTADRLPRMPDRVKRMTVVWDAGRAGTKAFAARLEELIKFKGLAILLVNGEAVLTDRFRKYAGRFLRARRVACVFDETSLLAKAAGNKRTKVLNGCRPLTTYRMILDGSPVGEGPMDLYSQFGLLSKEVFDQPTFQAFKYHYAEWEMKTYFNKKKGKDEQYPAIREDGEGKKMYLHLDELRSRMDDVSFICTRRECFDIPDKVYQPYRYELSREQRRVYDALRSTYEAELSSGATVTAAMVLTRYMRLQQVLSNFWPSERKLSPCPLCSAKGCEECDGLGALPYWTDAKVIDEKRNPRLEALSELMTVNRGPVIVWARFQKDVDDAVREAKRIGRTPVQYDGRVGPDDKESNRRDFQAGRADTFVANQVAGQRGIDLSAAVAHLYYSNLFSGLIRRQTEDRTEVAGRTSGTGVVDVTADDTVDEDITQAHLEKRSISEAIMARRRSSGRYLS